MQSQHVADEEIDPLSPPHRLALAYASALARPHWHVLLQLDRRFARIVGQASEPMLAQIRLAWWRELFGKPAADWPAGEPLLAALAAWDAHRAGLAALADGWEAMVGEPPLAPTSLAALADGRASALVSLANVTGSRSDAAAVEQAGWRWAIADTALHLTDGQERDHALGLLAGARQHRGKLDRAMRPLSVMLAMTQRAAVDARPIGGGGDFLAAVRAGLTGR